MQSSCDSFITSDENFQKRRHEEGYVSPEDSHTPMRPEITDNHLSIFRPRFMGEDQCLEPTDFNQPYRDESNSYPSATQRKRCFHNASGSARQVSVGYESTFSSPRDSFDASAMCKVNYSTTHVATMTYPPQDIIEIRDDLIEGHVQSGMDREERSRVNGTSVLSRHESNMRNPSPLVGDKRKREDSYGTGMNIAVNSLSSPPWNYRALLVSRAKLFTHFTFLLPELKISVMNYTTNQKNQWSLQHRTVEDVIARRRLVCSVQAYGGNMFQQSKNRKQNNVSSIFRRKDDEGLSNINKGCYEEQLQLQYFENGSHLSWDVEECKLQANLQHSDGDRLSTKKETINADDDDKHSTPDVMDQSAIDGGAPVTNDESIAESDDSPKLKYRCKLCGQPKQNHTCPFQQELQRSIGTMAYVALNAFQSQEPGELATSLSEMNNFVDLENDENGEDLITNRVQRTVEVVMPSFRLPDKEFIGKRRKTRINSNGSDRQYKGDEKLFHEIMDIKPEQYRLVSVHRSNLIGDFKYPSLPLTFDQRKGASEDLFGLCQEIPGLTDDCAKVLQIARKTDLWDLAVAELITQILVATKCGPGDEILDGLRRHLMCMGFSC